MRTRENFVKIVRRETEALLKYKGGKFFLKKKSGKWRSNKHRENALVVHAFRRFASGISTGIIVNTYGGDEK